MKKILIIGIGLVLATGGFLLLRRHATNTAPYITAEEPQTNASSTAPGSTSHPSAYNKAGTYSESIVTADGRTRTYLLHVPAGYSTNKQYPLVLLFHGGHGTSKGVLDKTKFAAKADAEGFIVVAPQGVGQAWNTGLGDQATAETQHIDDVSFVRQLVASLENKLSIDRTRIYASGESRGGQLSELLGCQAADIFAAIAPEVGPLTGGAYTSCKPSQGISVVGIQGAADPLANINGGTGKEGGTIESAATTMAFWASANHCSATPTVTHPAPRVEDGTSVDLYTYTGCDSGKDVQYYIVQGMGHSWPPVKGAGGSLTGPTSNNINATDVFWDFFKAHHK